MDWVGVYLNNGTIQSRLYRLPCWIGMVGVLLVVFGVMAHGLDDLVLWADEAWTVYASDPDVAWSESLDRVVNDIHPPFFFLGLHGWREFTGETVFEMRYYAVLLIMLSTALVYRLGAAMFAPGAGLIAALLYALHDLIHVFGQEVRHYSQQQLMVLVVMWAYWRFWQQPDRRRAIGLALAGAALLWSYYWGGFVLAALGIHALLTRRNRWQTIVPTFAMMGLLFVPWLPALLRQVNELSEGLSYTMPNTWDSVHALSMQIGGRPEAVWWLLVGLGILGSLHVARWRVSARTGILAAIIAVTFGGSVALNEAYSTLFTRSQAVVIPAVMLLVGAAISRFRWPEQGVMLAAIVLSSITLSGAAPPGRTNWPVVADYLAAHSTPNDLIVLELNNRELKYLQELTLEFYLDRANATLRSFSTEGARVDDPARFQGVLDARLDGEHGLWVVKLGWPYYDLRVDLRDRGFVESAPVIAWDPFAGLPVELWRFDQLPDNAARNHPRLAFGEDGANTTGMALAHATAALQGETVVVNLLWSPPVTPDADYTVSVFLLDESGALVKQHDSPPFEGRTQTSQWESGGLYFDTHALEVDTLSRGAYQVGVKVYRFADATYQDVVIAPASECSATCDFALIETITIK